MSYSSFDSPTDRRHRVSIIGAGRVGSTLAQRLVEKNIADVVLLDIVEGMPQGIALDLMEARGVERHDRLVIGTSNYADTSNSDVVVITAGRPRLPGMNREDLIKTNARIVADAAQKAIDQSPDAILIVVTNPLDVMTYLAWEASGLPQRRVVGMAGVLDAARFKTFIAMELGVSIQEINAMVMGDHGQLMVPLPRYSTVAGVPITELMDSATIDRLVERTRNGGTEVMELMKTGSAYFAPASSIALMVESILHNQSQVVPAAAYLQGEYGLQDIFLGVPCLLGYQGVERVVELNLTPAEMEALAASGEVVRQNVERAKVILS
ncbi:malate dehydrogenase [[Phormidium] sp. ETS-05]|uniref:malate dehydrogenase n=1 Tax=[Phormidium] sp. ETS-05 TaxID=222819 RepID=UPI0018EF18DC|nr:malate dehydrogenase [[Phormidium] sp. ETS-05]